VTDGKRTDEGRVEGQAHEETGRCLVSLATDRRALRPNPGGTQTWAHLMSGSGLSHPPETGG